MERLLEPLSRQTESPDPASHAANAYDAPARESETDELDDDDMDFEPASDDSDDAEYFDADEDDQDYRDADDGLSGVDIEFAIEGDQSEGDDGEDSPPPNPQPVQETGAANAVRRTFQVSDTQIMQLLGHAGLRRIFANHSGALLDIDDEGRNHAAERRRRQTHQSRQHRYPAVPSEEGTKLMRSGTFGSTDYHRETRIRRNKKLATRIMNRELGIERSHSTSQDSIMAQDLIPSTKADSIIHYNARCYSGQFSDDGNFFFSCAQDMRVRMYDTSNPYNWRYYKTVQHPFSQWTITDASLSPDNKYLAYTSITDTVCLAATDPGETREPHFLDFSDTVAGGGRHRAYRGGRGHFGIWSIRFSGDGRELVAGTNDHSVLVYDIDSRKTVLRIEGHDNDVNAVCFGDTSSPHILYSGSDDTLIKVWDRRSMGDSREAGVFMGHTEGLTYVDSKGDGRYVLSNGKDQTMKLWDLRMMMSTEKASRIKPGRLTTPFDYRFMTYPEEDYKPHPNDCSLVTYRGHRVLKTLIRCHFSPPGSTDSRYVYSGSEDGRVYIYNLDAKLAATIDVLKATHNGRPKGPESYHNPYLYDDSGSGVWKTCVRDVSWHPNAPVIAATSWNGYGMSTGTCTIHSWNDGVSDDEGEPKMGQRVSHTLEHDDALYKRPSNGSNQRGSRLRSRRVANPDPDDDVQESNAW